MLHRLDLTGFDGRPNRGLLPRAQFDIEAAAVAIAPIVHGVRDHGYQAARAASLKFDGVDVADPRVSPQAIAHALATVPDDVRAALTESIRRARIGHEAQRRQTVRAQIVPGGSVTEKWIPVERVGLYAPGGVTALPSSVIMNVVPAQIAGVDSLAVFSPPQREFGGLPHPTVLAACALLGIDEVYAVGGAQAIALMAYGDADIGLVPVDMATGPGNVYTTAAKRMLRAVVGIDSEAGTTEIAVLADAGADPGHVAADLISQAEHDPNAASVLVTDSVALAAAVDAEIERQLPLTKHVDRVRAALSGPQSASVLVRDLDQGLAVVDAYAAEHLEIITANARAVAERVRNAGAIFVGTWSPVSLGDYCAGSNHVLPTACTARHSSGLSVQTFLRGVHLIEYTEAALAQAAPFVLALSAAEDLPAHGAAVSARFPNSPTPRP